MWRPRVEIENDPFRPDQCVFVLTAPLFGITQTRHRMTILDNVTVLEEIKGYVK